MINKKTGVVISTIIVLAGIVAGTYLSSKNQNIEEKASSSTTLFINPTYQDLSASQNLNFTVGINSGENSVMGFDIELLYDPKIIEITQITPTSSVSNFTNTIKNTIDNKNPPMARFRLSIFIFFFYYAYV